MEIFPFTINSGQFLGDDVVVAGTDITRQRPTCQIKIVDFSNNRSQEDIDPLSSKQRNMVIGEASLRGKCSAMEVCGVPSLNKNYIAVAASDAGRGFVSVLEVGVGLGGGLYSMTPLQSFERRPDEDSLVTSLAYFSHHTHLAAATEIGDVVITDLASAADITRQKVDPSGARAVRYTPSGMVVSLGQSKAGQVLLWDPRTAGSGSGSGDLNLLNFRRPLVDSAQGRGVSDKDSYLTCLETHPSNEYEFYCGTSTGSIVVWDVRKNDISESGTVVELERCQGSSGQEVTALAFRGGGRSPHLLSGAVDGSVACVNYHEKQLESSGVGRGGGGEVDIGFDQGTSAVSSLQCHPHTDKVLVTSKLGEVSIL